MAETGKAGAVTCRRCRAVLPDDEQGWNRARICPGCRAAHIARHALSTPDDEEES